MPKVKNGDPHPHEKGFAWNAPVQAYTPTPTPASVGSVDQLADWYRANPDVRSATEKWGNTPTEQRAFSDLLKQTAVAAGVEFEV